MIERINNGELDAEFRKYGGIGVPTMVTFKEKIHSGKSAMEKQMKKREKRQALEDTRLRNKLQSALPEIYVIIYFIMTFEITLFFL